MLNGSADRPATRGIFPRRCVFRYFGCNMRASDATEADATSWHLTQHCPVTAVLPAGSPCGRDLSSSTSRSGLRPAGWASRGLGDDKATTVKPPCQLRHVTTRDSAEPSAAPGNVPDPP